MNYFILTQDERMVNVVEPVGITQVIKRELLVRERLDELDELDCQFPVLEKRENDYIDYIERPYPLLSDPFKRLVQRYEPKMPLKSVVLMDSTNMIQRLYWLMVPPTVACLSDESEFHRDGTVKKLVIEEELAASYTIFKVEGLKEDYVIVNLAIAESLLRRAYRGIRLHKVQTTGRWNQMPKVHHA